MSTDPETIKSYDENAEAWAKRMRSNKSKSHMHLEKPAMMAALPDLEGLSVLCVGCGSGEECQALKDKGTSRVVGIDISKGLIEQAKYAYPEIEFHAMDMERLSFEKNSFDFAYSSLVLHYVPDWRPTLNAVSKVLKTGGKFLFSTHHPVRFASETHKQGDLAVSRLGYSVKDGTGEYEIYGDYLNPRAVQDIWFDKVKVRYHHKPISAILAEIRDSEFELTGLLEPKAAESIKKISPYFYDIHQKIPLFLICELTKS